MMTWWALLYALSMLARYYPDLWVKMLNLDHSPDGAPPMMLWLASRASCLAPYARGLISLRSAFSLAFRRATPGLGTCLTVRARFLNVRLSNRLKEECLEDLSAFVQVLEDYGALVRRPGTFPACRWCEPRTGARRWVMP